MRKLKIAFIISIVIFGGIFFFRDNILDFYSELSLNLPQIEKEAVDFFIEETKKQISIPPPLRVSNENQQSFLTREGAIQWTNIQREKYGLPPLEENLRLNVSAEAKVHDMFAEQYFSHYSPSGTGVGDLIEDVGYEFIAIGENLALGNFQDDKDLIQGWMDSLGHRDNILNSKYQEIGIAVVRGIFEERSTWIAVQHFGTSLSACLQPDGTLEVEIELNQNQITQLQNKLELLKTEIQIIKPKRGSIYNQKIKQYNTLIVEYNILVDETQDLIKVYNSQVKLFNECVAGI